MLQILVVYIYSYFDLFLILFFALTSETGIQKSLLICGLNLIPV